jgi:hypothetical protein
MVPRYEGPVNWKPREEKHLMDVRLWGRIIGRVPFTDGINRDLYEDAEGDMR